MQLSRGELVEYVASFRALLRAEIRIERAALDCIDDWLEVARYAVLAEVAQAFSVTAAGYHDPSRAVDAATLSYEAWRRSMNNRLLPQIGIAFGEAYNAVRRTTRGSSYRYEQEYLASVSDRLKIWPEGAFEDIRPELMEALAEGEDFDQIRDRIGRVLGIDSHTRVLRARIQDIDDELAVGGLDHNAERILRATRRELWAEHDEALGDWRWKARRIARTEAHGARQGGKLAKAREAETATEMPWYKRWISTDDQRVRLSHRVADGQVVRLSDRFRVGGFLLDHPGDPNAGAPHETISCRCDQMFYDDYLLQDALQGPHGSIGEIRPGGIRLGPDDPDDADVAIDKLAEETGRTPPRRRRGEDEGQTPTEQEQTPQPVELTDERERVMPDLTGVPDDELLAILEGAHDDGDHDLYDWVDAEWERRYATQHDDDPDVDMDDADDDVAGLPDYSTDPEPDSLDDWWGDEPPAPLSESDRLVEEFTQALTDNPDITEDELIAWEQRIADAEAREQAAQSAKDKQIEVWRQIDELVDDTGMDYDQAEAQVTGKTIEQLRRSRFVDQAINDGVLGADGGFEAALKSVHDNMVAEWYLAAEEATNGHLVRRASIDKFDPSMFWSVNDATARKHMSDELAAWFDENGGRVTRNDLRAMIDAGEYTIQRRRGDYLQ